MKIHKGLYQKSEKKKYSGSPLKSMNMSMDLHGLSQLNWVCPCHGSISSFYSHCINTFTIYVTSDHISWSWFCNLRCRKWNAYLNHLRIYTLNINAFQHTKYVKSYWLDIQGNVKKWNSNFQNATFFIKSYKDKEWLSFMFIKACANTWNTTGR